RRDIAGNAALPSFDLPAVLELDRLAHDRLPAIGQGGEVLPHGCKGHARFPRDLQVQALSMLLEALQGFDHGDRSSEMLAVGRAEKKRPREVGVFGSWRPHGDSNPGYRRERIAFQTKPYRPRHSFLVPEQSLVC